MANKLIKGVLASAVIAALAGCNSDEPTNPNACVTGNECVKFTVLHTNDNHGRFWESKYGEYGMAARKTLINQIRDEVESAGGQTILLSGGDINTGVPESDMQDAVPDFIGMSSIGYDAMAVGNHEFDNSLDVLEMQRKLANFPMLAANIYHKEADGSATERYFDAYKVFDVNGIKIAVIGLTTPDTFKLVNPENVQNIYFADPQDEIRKTIAEIKANEKDVDVIFATTHMGHYADGNHGSEAPGDVLLARSLEAGQLQAVFGGHSQQPVCMEPGTNDYADFKPGDDCTPDQQNGTYIMQAHEWGKYVGRADFEYVDGKLNLVDYALIPVNLKVKNEAGERVFVTSEIAQDAELKELLAGYQAKGQELLDVVISSTDGKLVGDRDVVRTQQTNLGQLLGEAYRSFELVNADFMVMNSGGIRDSIPEGPIAYRDVLTVQPFGNFVTKATMTGAEVQEYLNAVTPLTGGAYAQLRGIKLDVNCDTKTAKINEINNNVFDAAAEYTFAVISFSANGGDGYPKIKVEDTQRTDADVLREFFVKNQNIDAASYNPVAGDVTYTLGGAQVSHCGAKAE